MALEGVNRYNDLIKAIPGGSFYASAGIVLPYRSGNTEIQLETDYADTSFGLYLNEKFAGEVVSDANGNITFERHLEMGEVQIQLLNGQNGKALNSFVTIRDYALWLAAYAEALENLDDDFQNVRDNISIETATIDSIEDVYGTAIGVYNTIGQDLDTYREMLHELRLAFRNFGTRYRGLDTSIAAFTQVPPFGYDHRLWGSNWVLDQSMLENHRFQRRSHSIEWDGIALTGVDLVEAEPSVEAGLNHALLYDSSTDAFRFYYDGTTPGDEVPARPGPLFIPGPARSRSAFLWGILPPFTVTAGVNDTLYIEVDDKGIVPVVLGAGLPNPTALQVATAINAIFTADPRYGASYSAIASSLNTGVLIESPLTADSSVKLHHGPQNAAVALFGDRHHGITHPESVISGVYFKEVTGSPLINGDAEIEYNYNPTVDPIVQRLRWKSPGDAFGAWVDIDGPGTYTLTDGSGNSLVTYCHPDAMEVFSADTYQVTTFKLGFSRVSRFDDQAGGIWINVTDIGSLPAGFNLRGFDVDDVSTWTTEALRPENWFFNPPSATASGEIRYSEVSAGRSAPEDPAASYQWRITDSAQSSVTVAGAVLKYPKAYPGDRGSNWPQRSSNLLYDYEGFTVRFQAWVRNLSTNAGTARVGLLFNNSIISGSTIPIPPDPGEYGDYRYIEVETIIPAGIAKQAAQDVEAIAVITLGASVGTVDMIIDSPSIEVEYISSRYLTHATVSRNRHRQYYGEFLYLWSPEELTLNEQVYLGVFHKKSDTTKPYAGVQISAISPDTPAGKGTLEYEYNSAGDTHRLRWNPHDDAWTLANGWVSILSDGAYQLEGPSGDYLSVDVLYDLLPVLPGTPPAATRSRDVTISDITTNQGVPRRMAPASAALDIFDVSEYSAGNPINLKGATTEADFSQIEDQGLMVNVETDSATPFRFSFVKPDSLEVEQELLSVSGLSPHTANLSKVSDSNEESATLYADGEIIPNDKWYFNTAQQIIIADSEFVSGAIYELSYSLLYQVTTLGMDLEATFTDYAWFADYYLWERRDSDQDSYDAEVSLFFNPANGRAILERRSDMNRATAKLIVQDAQEQREISARYWRFIDDKTVEIDVSQLIGGAQYFLQHYEKRVYERRRLDGTLRADPVQPYQLPGVEITGVSSSALVGELQIEYRYTAGPTYEFRLTSPEGGIGDWVAVTVDGEAEIFDEVGNSLVLDITIASLSTFPVTVRANVLVRNDVRFEHRSATTLVGLDTADWQEIDRNENVDGTHQYHQLRLSVGNIRDLRDFRIRSLVLKGLHLHGSSPSVPGLTNNWGG